MELQWWCWAVICPLVFLAGLIDSMAGGGGLISLPAYLAVGLPPHLAAGSNKLSASMGTVLSTARFLKSGKAALLPALCAAVIALIGSYLGAELAMRLDAQALRILMLAAIPVVALVVLLNKKLGASDRTARLRRVTLLLLCAGIGLAMGVYDGLFGPGTGTFLILLFAGVVGFDLLTACGNAKIVNLASNIAALAAFILNGQVLWALALPAGVCGILGNYLGAGLALRRGSRVIRPVFLIVLGLLFGKMAVDLLAG